MGTEKAMTECCSNCRFFVLKRADTPQFPDVNGMCRRYAPQGFTPQRSGLLFPPMNSGQWCGDHRPRADSAPDGPAAPAAAMAV